MLESNLKWPTIKAIVDPKGPFIRKWNVIFIVSCVFAVLLDPLFLYIPIVNEEMKCMRMDSNLKITALVLRSLTDLFFMLNIYFQVLRCNNCIDFGSFTSIPSIKNILLNTMSNSYILIDILAVLPLPQVAVLILLSKMRGSATLGTLMNFLVLVQYVPRVLRIYLSCKESATTSREETPLWIKGVLNLFLYILACHVLGAFWYFFAVQRITTCWQNACRKRNRCESSNFECHDYPTLRNNTFLSDSCPIDPANAKVFDFGMFLDVLQFGILGSTAYPRKFAKCFWWGLQNLSSLGSNLPLSINTWENLFAAFVSIIGLLLFLYLMGNLQTYMQLDVARLENHRWKMRIQKKMDQKEGEVEKWMAQNGIPLHKKSDIMAKVLVELKENKDVEVEDIMSILPLDLQNYVTSCMPLSRLREVSLLQDMDEAVLKELSEYLKPKKYKKNDIIIDEDKPLVMMAFMVDGIVSIEKRDRSSTLQRGGGEVYGEQLLCWPAWTSFPGISHESVRAIGDVQALVLMARDMEHVCCKFRSRFPEEVSPLSDERWELLDDDYAVMLRKVPKLRNMDTQILNAISRHLKPPKDGTFDFINEGSPVGMMMFMVGGSIATDSKTRDPYAEEENDADEEYDINGYLVCHAGYFFGEELLDWVLDTSFPALLPRATCNIWNNDNADVLFLMAEDLANVVSEYRSNFSRLFTPPPTDLIASLGLYYLKKEFNDGYGQYMDDEVLREMAKHMKHMSYGGGAVVIEEHKPLEMMFVMIEGERMKVRWGSFESDQWRLGDFYGYELLRWITNWAVHTSFPDKLPLSCSSASVRGGANAELLVLLADDLKRIVFKFKTDFIKETTLPIDSEGKLVTFDDPLTMLKKVPMLENMNERVMKAISSYLRPMKYSEDLRDWPIIYKPKQKIDKMFFIKKGLVSALIYRMDDFPLFPQFLYSGNYFGEQLLEYVLDASVDEVPTLKFVEIRCVGEVEVLVLMAEDLAKVVSEFSTHFARQIA